MQSSIGVWANGLTGGPGDGEGWNQTVERVLFGAKFTSQLLQVEIVVDLFH